MKSFDLIVVGAGASGAVVAGRASEDPGRSVPLLEAGDIPRTPDDFPVELLDAAQVPGARPGPGHHWSYPARLTADRSATVFRGRDRWTGGIRARLGTSLHASGTAPMGSAHHPAAVVDQFGRVHGVAGLRIADTSILPAAPRAAPRPRPC